MTKSPRLRNELNSDADNAVRPSIDPRDVRSTGADNPLQQKTRCGWRSSDTRQLFAKQCETEFKGKPKSTSPKPFRIADLGEEWRLNAISHESSGGGTRTPDTRIMIPLL